MQLQLELEHFEIETMLELKERDGDQDHGTTV